MTFPAPNSLGQAETHFMALPRIRICTPSLNQGSYIESTICSVLDQNYSQLEYVVIDGGSTDNTVDILKRYQSRFTYWVSEQDAGQASAINRGLCNSDADIFAWLNSDDVLLPHALEQVAMAWSQGHRFIAGKASFRNETGEQIVWRVKNLPRNAKEVLNYPLDQYLPQPSVFFSSAAWNEVGGLDETLHYGMDTDLWIRLAQVAPLHLIDDELSWMRLHPVSKTVSRGFMLHKDYRLVLRRHRDLISFPQYIRLYIASLQRSSEIWQKCLYNSIRASIKGMERSLIP